MGKRICGLDFLFTLYLLYLGTGRQVSTRSRSFRLKLRKYTAEQLKEAVANNHSLRAVLRSLNIVAAGGNYGTLRKAIAFYKLDTSHFKGKGWNKGLKLGPKRDLSVYLSNQQPIQSNKLRKRLLKEKVFEPECSVCRLDTWQGHPIPLELDHINGQNDDNRLENLRILCPNCHAQTPTYRGRNIGNYKLRSGLPTA